MLPASDSYPTRFFCIFLAWDAFAHLEDQTKKSLESVEEEKLFLPVVDVTGHRHARLPASTRHPGLTYSIIAIIIITPSSIVNCEVKVSRTLRTFAVVAETCLRRPANASEPIFDIFT